MDGSINLLLFEKWLDDQIKVCFKPLADMPNKQDLTNEVAQTEKLVLWKNGFSKIFENFFL